MRLLYYVSGHGYGHAVRAAEIIRVIAEQQPTWHLFVKTTAPKWLFDGVAPSQLEIIHTKIDSGAREANNSLVIDSAGTVQALVEFVAETEPIIKQEARWVQENHIGAIIADIPYLAGNIGDSIGVPCIGCSNFLWDFIYEPLLADTPGASEILGTIRDGYSRMDAMLRLPFCHEMSVFPKLIDVPLVAPRPQRSTSYVRDHLRISRIDSRPIVYFGMRDAIQPSALERTARGSPDVILVYFGVSVTGLPENTRALEFDSELRFADFIAACETVVSKPGYGMFAACVANQVNILFPRRTGFREDEYLIRDAARYTRLRELPAKDFEDGNWSEHIRLLRSQQYPGETLQTDGAEVCARFVISQVENW